MRNTYTFLLLMLLSVFMLSACGENDATEDKNEGKDGDETTTDEVANKEEESKETTKISNPSGIEGIFLQAADVMSGIQGMTLTGEIISASDTMGIIENSTTQVTATLTENGQYYKMDTESDLDGSYTTETYITDDGMYLFEEDGGWMLLPVIENDPTSVFTPGVSEVHFHSLAKLHDLFELTEDKDHYILTFDGEGEAYKEVSLGYLREIDEEIYEDFAEMLSDSAGSYTYTIDKNTFHVVGLDSDTDKIIDVAVETHSKDQISYQYSDFNDVEDVVVPSEVVESAQVIDMSGGGVEQ